MKVIAQDLVPPPSTFQPYAVTITVESKDEHDALEFLGHRSAEQIISGADEPEFAEQRALDRILDHLNIALPYRG